LKSIKGIGARMISRADAAHFAAVSRKGETKWRSCFFLEYLRWFSHLSVVVIRKARRMKAASSFAKATEDRFTAA
jgi:hypothetical protein